MVPLVILVMTESHQNQMIGGRLIVEFLNFFNLKAVNFDSVYTGPTDTFFSFDERFSSAIDLKEYCCS